MRITKIFAQGWWPIKGAILALRRLKGLSVDMARLGLQEAQLVAITSPRGCLLIQAKTDAQVAPTQAFLAMHWGSEVLGGTDAAGQPAAGVNVLMPSGFCPTSKQPELKHAAVRIEGAKLAWHLVAQAWLPAEQAERTRAALRELFSGFEFASCVPFSNGAAIADAGTERHGLLFRAAAAKAPDMAIIQRIEALLLLTGPDTLRYTDPRLGQSRAVRLRQSSTGDTLVDGILLCGDTASEAWLANLLRQSLPAQSLGRQLLSGSATSPVKLAATSSQVCACFNVTKSVITDVLSDCAGSPKERMAQLQAATRCGTNCGSCLPEIKRLVSAIPDKIQG